MNTVISHVDVLNISTPDYEVIYFAGGCFWGTQEYFARVPGVLQTAVGYANGTIEHPTYEQVCSGTTGFAETVAIYYDPKKVQLGSLLHLYYRSVDPFSHNRQGGDIGTQYRTGIYYTTLWQKNTIFDSLCLFEQKLGKKTAIEVEVLQNFYLAESYHQDYLKKNPGGYCHIPKDLFDFAALDHHFAVRTDDELKQSLSELEYEVTRHSATEPPFANAYDAHFQKGIYVDITTGEPLFLSADKFDSGCGWPAFSKPIHKRLITESTDTSHGMLRTEVKSTLGNSHLGHVFEDGPKETGGIRYCINSASLRFIPYEELEAKGYGSYKHLFD